MLDLIDRSSVLSLARDIVIPTGGVDYRYRCIDPDMVKEIAPVLWDRYDIGDLVALTAMMRKLEITPERLKSFMQDVDHAIETIKNARREDIEAAIRHGRLLIK